MQQPAQDLEAQVSQPAPPAEAPSPPPSTEPSGSPKPNLQVFEGGTTKPSSSPVPPMVEPAAESTVPLRSVDTMTPAARAAEHAYENQPPGPPLPPTPEPAVPSGGQDLGAKPIKIEDTDPGSRGISVANKDENLPSPVEARLDRMPVQDSELPPSPEKGLDPEKARMVSELLEQALAIVNEKR